eukprot:4755410-Pleurochrysis_carterae.AAC.4
MTSHRSSKTRGAATSRVSPIQPYFYQECLLGSVRVGPRAAPRRRRPRWRRGTPSRRAPPRQGGAILSASH